MTASKTKSAKSTAGAVRKSVPGKSVEKASERALEKGAPSASGRREALASKTGEGTRRVTPAGGTPRVAAATPPPPPDRGPPPPLPTPIASFNF